MTDGIVYIIVKCVVEFAFLAPKWKKEYILNWHSAKHLKFHKFLRSFFTNKIKFMISENNLLFTILDSVTNMQFFS